MDIQFQIYHELYLQLLYYKSFLNFFKAICNTMNIKTNHIKKRQMRYGKGKEQKKEQYKNCR